MNGLLRVDYSCNEPRVSARRLHEFLEVSTRFNDWFARMCEYGFNDGPDFYSILSKSSGGRPGKNA